MPDSDTPSEETPAGETPAEPTTPEPTPETTPGPDAASTDAAGGAAAPSPDATATAGPAADATVEVPASAATPTEPTATGPTASPTPVPAAGVPAPRSSHVMVPKWAAFLVAGLLLVGAGFGAGWFLNDDDNDSSAAVHRPELPTQDDSRPFGDDSRPFGGDEAPGVESTTFLGVSTAPTDDDSGVRIAAVLDDSPADDAGLEADDVILEVDGEAVSTPRELVAAIQALDSGDAVTITYERDGDEDTVDVTLTERDDDSANLRPS